MVRTAVTQVFTPEQSSMGEVTDAVVPRRVRFRRQISLVEYEALAKQLEG
jgi:hypothetical protein